MNRKKHLNKLLYILFFCGQLLLSDLNASYSAPILIFPLEKKKITFDAVTFIWNSENHQSLFIIEVSKNTKFNPLVYRKETYLFDDNPIENFIEFSSGRYYWRVGEKQDKNISYSNVSYFEIGEKKIDPIKIETEKEVEKNSYIYNTAELEQKLHAAEKENKKISDELQKMINLYDMINKNHTLKSNDYKSKLKDNEIKFNEYTEKLKKSNFMIQNLTALNEKTNTEIEELKKDYSNALSKYETKKTELERKLYETQKLLNEEIGKREHFADISQSLYGKNEKMQSEIDKLQKQLSVYSSLNRHFAEKENEFKTINNELSVFKVEKNTLTRQIIALESEKNESAKKNENMNDIISKLNNDISKLKADYAKSLIIAGDLIAENENLKKNLHSHTNAILNDRFIEINNAFDISKYKTNKNYQNWIDKILADCEKANELLKNNDYYFNLAVLYFKSGNFNKALNNINKISNPNETDLTFRKKIMRLISVD
ncbi:MAG TPA: hypothetical protein PLJ38_00290 [bacterium]|nr:hypothetical protein [bacterium]